VEEWDLKVEITRTVIIQRLRCTKARVMGTHAYEIEDLVTCSKIRAPEASRSGSARPWGPRMTSRVAVHT
jgi:hypothetical protein